MSWKEKRRRLDRLSDSEPPAKSFLGRRRWWAYLVGELPYEALSEIERLELAEEQQKHERDHDPPDSIERRLARLIAEARDEPDPYGTGGLSEAERRAWDWKDYHEKERRRHEDQAQAENQTQYGLRELPPSDTMNGKDSEQPKGKPRL
jgi:hypothetical protein